MTLYHVTLEYEVTVEANSEGAARCDARDVVEDIGVTECRSHVAIVETREDATRLSIDTHCRPEGSSTDWTIGEILDGLPNAPPPDAPPSLDEVPAWLDLRTHDDREPQRPDLAGAGHGWRWWTNVRALLAFPLAAEPDETHHNADGVQLLLEGAVPHHGMLERRELDRACGAGGRPQRLVRIGGAVGGAVIDARLMRRWVWGAAHAGGDEVITVEWAGEHAPVRFSGRGWRAVVMPVRLDEGDEYTIHPVEVRCG